MGLFFACKTGRIDRKLSTAVGPGSQDDNGSGTGGQTGCTASQYNYNIKDVLADGSQVAQGVSLNLKPEIIFYGNAQSAMMVIDLPDYSYFAKTLQLITVFRPSGDPICEKRIESASDINSTNYIRPIVFDNISLKNDKKLTLLFKEGVSNGVKYSRYDMEVQVAFTDTFMGKPVRSANDPLVSAYRGYPNFKLDKDNSLPRSIDNVISLDGTARYSPAIGLNKCILADMMNRPLRVSDGALFKDIGDINQFICYQKVNDGDFYVRTFVRVF